MNACRRQAILAAGLALAAVCTAARADEPADAVSALRLNGFGTLGFTRMSDTPGWGFRRDASQPYNDGGTRADTDSRLGLQANYIINPQLEVVGQLLLRRRAASSVPVDSLEWGFASYSPTADITIRAGRFAPDIFLLSDHRNVGFAYPWVRPNSEAYGLLPVFSLHGADVERIWDVGDVRWRARLLAGAGGTRLPTGTATDVFFRIKSQYGGVLSREEGGLLLRATLSRAKGEFENLPQIEEIDSGLARLESFPVPQIASDAAQLRSLMGYGSGNITYTAFGMAYDHGPWLVHAEYLRFTSNLAYARTQYAYVGAARRIDAVSIFGMLGTAHSRAAVPMVPQWQAQLAPLVGPATAAQLQALGTAAALIGNARVYQRSISIGARWDVHPQIALKLQLDHFRIDADGGGIWGHRTYDPVSPNIVSATMDFVF